MPSKKFYEVMKRISCKPKALPHYFGRGIHAIDVLDYAKNEGTLQVLMITPCKKSNKIGLHQDFAYLWYTIFEFVNFMILLVSG